MSREQVAADVLACALAHDPESRLIGNVRAIDVAMLAALSLHTCPVCGAEAWVNIDCSLCDVVGDTITEER
jgi:hypothetical protein